MPLDTSMAIPGRPSFHLPIVFTCSKQPKPHKGRLQCRHNEQLHEDARRGERALRASSVGREYLGKQRQLREQAAGTPRSESTSPVCRNFALTGLGVGPGAPRSQSAATATASGEAALSERRAARPALARAANTHSNPTQWELVAQLDQLLRASITNGPEFIRVILNTLHCKALLNLHALSADVINGHREKSQSPNIPADGCDEVTSAGNL
ncbi:hypothetical protein FIBSPDRAFT_901302 [Athelia psychrophila]|uniref:Uncharacterized protein n=1 Tax=Athelia psychrophila TaxID=1759441 RepID=A0A165XCC0_9AGAM|nr:hypothetical protein FIBSPDRAFT_901302 [Fibularhizoctonia sp. CBS 109695]